MRKVLSAYKTACVGMMLYGGTLGVADGFVLIKDTHPDIPYGRYIHQPFLDFCDGAMAGFVLCAGIPVVVTALTVDFAITRAKKRLTFN